MKVKELLKTERDWTKGAFERDEDGNLPSWSNKKPICYCLWGAIGACYSGQQTVSVMEKVCKYLNVETYINVGKWNDGATFAEVKELINKLDI